MQATTQKYCLALTTMPDHEQAVKLAKHLINLKLAACVNILPSITSVYNWEDNLETIQEVQVVIKTKLDLVKKLEDELINSHPYDCPEFVVIPITTGNSKYLDWIDQNCTH